MKCPKCKNNVLQRSGNKTRLRTKGQLVFEDGVCRSKCYWCKEPIEIPVEIKVGTPVATERFLITEKKK